jgi:hypothetical protein
MVSIPHFLIVILAEVAIMLALGPQDEWFLRSFGFLLLRKQVLQLSLAQLSVEFDQNKESVSRISWALNNGGNRLHLLFLRDFLVCFMELSLRRMWLIWLADTHWQVLSTPNCGDKKGRRG